MPYLSSPVRPMQAHSCQWQNSSLDTKALSSADEPTVPVTQVDLTNEESPKPVLSLGPIQDRQRQPLPRLKRNAISNPTFNILIDLAADRVLDVILKCTKNPPPRLFPNSEHIRHTFFPVSVWEQYGDMEDEFGRISYMLAQYCERGIPLHCSPSIRTLLSSSSNPLENWSEITKDLADQGHLALKEAVKAMHPDYPQTSRATWSKADFVRTPVGYPTDRQTSIDLWSAAVERMASDLEAGRSNNIEAFLHIHAFIKDSIGGLRSPSQRQIVIFSELWSRTQTKLPQTLLTQKTYQQIAAQLALESSFLSIPKLQKINHIHFSHHQQLCYVYTTMDHLPRAEFSVPSRVLEILSEIILEAAKVGTCAMAPIAIAYASPMDPNGKPFKVIIDGNNRVSALVLLRFLATQSDPDMIDPSTLDAHCTARGLGPKWILDIHDAISTLLRSHSTLDLVRKHWNAIQIFSTVSRVPALVVQEPSFFTLCLRRGTNEKPILLQPMHQTIFNDDALCVAFPAKGGQAHGRSFGYAVLPVKFEGE